MSIIIGDAFSQEIQNKVSMLAPFPLIICDPPYGNIVKDKWDATSNYPGWFELCIKYAAPDATIAMWGGVGKCKNRPFILFAATLEEQYPDWQISDWITWSKKRAYGKPRNYLFTREECLIITRGKPTFNIPLLDKERGYAGYNSRYPAKSKYLRRTNVWNDITELFKNKIHSTQKPDRLYEVLIETHSKSKDFIFDPCAGSGTTARAASKLDRDYCVVELNEEYLKNANLMI